MEETNKVEINQQEFGYERKKFKLYFTWNFPMDNNAGFGSNLLFDTHYDINTGKNVFRSGERVFDLKLLTEIKYAWNPSPSLILEQGHWRLEVSMKIMFPPKRVSENWTTKFILNSSNVSRTPLLTCSCLMNDGMDCAASNVECKPNPIPEKVSREFPSENNGGSHESVAWLTTKYNCRAQSLSSITFALNIIWNSGHEPMPESKLISLSSSSSLLTPRTSLSLNTSDLLLSSNCSDFKICCEDKTFHAHKLILADRSSVFRTMFSQPNMVENIEGRMTIEDFDADAVEELLRFIYTGSVVDLPKHSKDLYIMADKYDLQDLKRICQNSLLETVSRENVLEVYGVGKLLNSMPIVEKCVQIAKANKYTTWKTMEEFDETYKLFPDFVFKCIC